MTNKVFHCRLQGQKDVPLNDVGRQQAKAVAERLVREIPTGPIYSSDLCRASETAQTIANARMTEGSGDSTVIQDPVFREGSVGVLEASLHLYEVFMDYRSSVR